MTALLAGTRTVEERQSIFGMNVSHGHFAEVSAKSCLPVDKAQVLFTPTVVNPGSEPILFGTGPNLHEISGALEAAG